MKLEGAMVVVVGMARSGVAAAELLRQKGARVRAVDQNPFAAAGSGIPVEIQTSTAFCDADLIVLSPGVPADLDLLDQAKKRGVPVVGDLELASWFLKGDIIGITGANGKTTTTALTGHILKACNIPAQVGGNIGTPPASMVSASRDGQWNVLELSSFQLETTDTFRARIGAALNVTPDHLDRHGTFERYAEAKARLFINQTAEDFRVLNADDETCRTYAHRGNASTVWFSSSHEVSPGVYLKDSTIYADGQPLMAADEVPLRGIHNIENTMAAAAVTRLAGATLRQIRNAVRTFPGVEHRLEFIRAVEGVEWFNDSKATNVDATLKAIGAFPGHLWVILGGKDKGGDYGALRRPLAEKARGVLLIGAAAGKIAAELKGALPLIPCGTLDRAVAEARAQAASGDVVLLAPACASFDQFENFEHRGAEFKRLVKDL